MLNFVDTTRDIGRLCLILSQEPLSASGTTN
jgi:hypothetical protein